jgi:hypothetical protein
LADPLDYFPNMLWKAWRDIRLPDPTPLQMDFCHYLDAGYVDEITGHAARGDVGARKILMAFRGGSKSYVTTAYGVCRLRRDRTERVLVTSATAKFAGSISSFAFKMVNEFDWLGDLKPRPHQRQSALAFDVNGAPAAKDESFCSESIFGQITGRRASLIIGDDLETPNTSDTEGIRQELRKRMGEFGAIILPGGDIYLLGTAQTENTIYKEYAEEKGYELRIYPIVYPIPDPDPKKDELLKYGHRLAPFVADPLKLNPELAGTSVEPSRFNEADIRARRLEWGGIEFDRQFKMFMDAGAGKGYPIKIRDLVVMELPVPSKATPLRLPSEIVFDRSPACKIEDIKVDALTGDSTLYSPLRTDIYLAPEEVICYVDPSGEGTDETTWTIGAGLLGRCFVLHQGASTEGHTKEVMQAIAKDCRTWGVQLVKVESNFGQGMFGELLQPHLKTAGSDAAVEDERQGKVQKEKRIVETIEPLASSNRLVIRAQLLRDDFEIDYPDVEAAKRRYFRLTYQLSRMTKQKGCVPFDDRADGLSGLSKHFIGVLLRQLENAKEQGTARALDNEIEKIIETRREQGLPLYGLDTKASPFGRSGPRPRR